MKSGIVFAAAFVGGALLLGPQTEAGSRSIIDDRGVEVEVPDAPKRLASLSYFATDVALALGIQPVATSYMVANRHPDFLLGKTADMVQLGQRAKPNLEVLSEAAPDLIVAIRRHTEANAEQLQSIASYLAYDQVLLESSFDDTAELSEILGKPERGRKLNADFRALLADVAEKAPKDTHPSFVVMWGGKSPFAFHTENTTAGILSAIGGENVMGPMSPGGKFGMEVGLETLLDKNPDVIFVYDYGAGSMYETSPAWQLLFAVKNDRVHYVSDHWVEANGPIARQVVLLQAAHYLYPDVFKDIDVWAEAARIIQDEAVVPH
ncbi:ABC transporter substrate-binding protein [Roseibium sp. RKSG952]|uniref:ABC transporter substrate-binding protein n=1 Tax=Roseibium sp. RKSG952 TaxID=2529384 RepID=UPI0012BC7530|nr:ABC transporter substrate-binding protein [Roseibium sp. RKSG952]MTH97305.1 ABC transporter substrate-binding protein [Roseibium sp. RKSG952]